jgi:hypothetical protein
MPFIFQGADLPVKATTNPLLIVLVLNGQLLAAGPRLVAADVLPAPPQGLVRALP